MYENIKKQDPLLHEALILEDQRQKDQIRLIPSENYTSKAVLEASGSILTNKYSEGYPGKRYYEGQEHIDTIETLACQRACELFKVDHANVQPYSGSPANLAAYFALLEPGDTVMGLSLSEGGHLTHGYKLNFSAKFFNSVSYQVDPKTETIDYDQIKALALKHKPKLIIAGYTAYPRQIDFKIFREIADLVGAYLLADISHINALVISGDHPDPAPYADVITTTTHKALRGPRGGLIMCKKEHKKAIDKAIMPGLQGGPHNHITLAKAIAFQEALEPDFKSYANQIAKNAKALSLRLLEKDFALVTGGTDTHLMILNSQKSHKLGGKDFAKALYKAGLVCNYNTVPFDPNPPMNPSGIRIGTPAITTLGMQEQDMNFIAEIIDLVAKNPNNLELLEKTRLEVLDFMQGFQSFFAK
ncbi:serine hydroxymethyltransferase [bacterium]|jgi:glycine hydroxymethyltransferase|nr:serine hydroxymethyltransferase [bacterium]MBT6293981.1 serine hydroxymethyltransferase [bacterium]